MSNRAHVAPFITVEKYTETPKTFNTGVQPTITHNCIP